MIEYSAGFEFDVGIHYIGNIVGTSMSRVLIDQITDGQLDWVPLDETYDTVILGDLDQSPRKVPMVGTGPENLKKKLIELFPNEKKGITDFMALLKVGMVHLAVSICKLKAKYLLSIFIIHIHCHKHSSIIKLVNCYFILYFTCHQFL